MITRFEDFLETRFEGFFKKSFPRQLTPNDLARALYKHMLHQRLKSIKYVYAPNYYLLRLNPRDYQSFAPYQHSLLAELADYLAKKAEERQLHLLQPLEIKLDFDKEIPLGKIKVFGRLQEEIGEQSSFGLASGDEDTLIYQKELEESVNEGENKPQYAIDVVAGVDEGKSFPLIKHRNLIGRQIKGEITLKDPSVSRHHAQLEILPQYVLLTDLDSTNGTWYKNEPADMVLLYPEATFQVGNTVLMLRSHVDD